MNDDFTLGDTDALWDLLATLLVENMHGGTTREWIVDEARSQRGEWVTRMNHRCPRGCRFCPRKPR